MISHLDREKRKKKLRADNQDAWRESVDFTKSINTISKVEGMLEADLDDPDNVKVTDVGKARLLLDSKWKRINKLLPDLKAVEGETTHTVNHYILSETHD